MHRFAQVELVEWRDAEGCDVSVFPKVPQEEQETEESGEDEGEEEANDSDLVSQCWIRQHILRIVSIPPVSCSQR